MNPLSIFTRNPITSMFGVVVLVVLFQHWRIGNLSEDLEKAQHTIRSVRESQQAVEEVTQQRINTEELTQEFMDDVIQENVPDDGLNSDLNRLLMDALEKRGLKDSE